jgi:hypothetical protein
MLTTGKNPRTSKPMRYNLSHTAPSSSIFNSVFSIFGLRPESPLAHTCVCMYMFLYTF